MQIRFRIVVLCGFLSLGSAMQCASLAEEPADPDWVQEFAAKKVVLQLPDTDKVTVLKGIACDHQSGPALKCDLYRPPNHAQAKKLPVVILIHGGPLPEGLRSAPTDWQPFISLARIVAVSGVACVTFNHRLHSWERLPDAQRDLDDVIAHLRAHAAELSLDPERISLWAFSAGGPLLSGVLRESPRHIRCLVAYYALLDLEAIRPGVPPTVSDETLRDFSPLRQLKRATGRLPAFFVVRAGLDETLFKHASERFVQEAFEQNATIEACNHAAGRHGFDTDNDDERTREILLRTLAFLREHG